jgi:hypothetical protein
LVDAKCVNPQDPFFSLAHVNESNIEVSGDFGGMTMDIDRYSVIGIAPDIRKCFVLDVVVQRNDTEGAVDVVYMGCSEILLSLVGAVATPGCRQEMKESNLSFRLIQGTVCIRRRLIFYMER